MGILSRNKIYAARSTPYLAARTFSSSRISPDSQPLSLISFGSKVTSHWALFLPYPQTPFYSTIWHFAEADSDNNERTMRSSSKFFWLPRRSHIVKQREGWNLRQGDGKCIDIGWALSTPDRITAAVKIAGKAFRYNAAVNNCQTFALEVLDILHAWNPNMVPASCLELAQRNAFVLGRHTTKARAIRGPRPVFASEAQEQVPAETRAWIALTASQLPSLTTPAPHSTTSRPHHAHTILGRGTGTHRASIRSGAGADETGSAGAADGVFGAEACGWDYAWGLDRVGCMWLR
jgi:hypothetical protein